MDGTGSEERPAQEVQSLNSTSSLLWKLDRESVVALQQMHGPQQRAEPDAHLVCSGDVASPLLTLSEGWAFRYSPLPDGGRQILSVAIPGDTIGLDTLVECGPAYPVQAGKNVAYRAITRDRAQRALEDATWFRDLAHRARQRERTEAERAFIRMSNCRAEQALASILLDFYHRLNGRRLAVDGQFRLGLSQQQLADFVGLTTTEMDAAFERLHARHLVSISGDIITIVSVSELECFAQGL